MPIALRFPLSSLLFCLLLFPSLAALAEGLPFLSAAPPPQPRALGADDAPHPNLAPTSCSRASLPRSTDLLVSMTVDGNADADFALPDTAVDCLCDGYLNRSRTLLPLPLRQLFFDQRIPYLDHQ